jgi:hypothetical protein
VVATVGALLSSSHRLVTLFGAANLVALPILVAVSTLALTSLWCVWAAATSVVIARHQRVTTWSPDGPPAPAAHMPTAALAGRLHRIHFGAR